MRTTTLTLGLCLLAGAVALGDEMFLDDGKSYLGTVVRWGATEVTFVPKGGNLDMAYKVKVGKIDRVVTSDGQEHVPGTQSWITNKRLSPEEMARLGLGAGKPRRPGGTARKGGFEYTVGLAGERATGYTDYHITINDSDLVWHSVLAYPIDVYRTAITAGVAMPYRGHQDQRLCLELQYARALSQPQEAMVDSDWVALAANPFNRWVFSATKSSSELSWHELDLSARLEIPVMENLEASLAAGYRYSRLSYAITGIRGWQEWYDNFGNFYHVEFDTLAGVDVLAYRVSYHLPYVALKLKVADVISGELLYTPVAMAYDFDDHLLRMKSATSSCRGSSHGLGIAGQVPVYQVPGAGTVSLGGSYRLFRITATGSQEQRFYGDDPGTPDDETGLTFTDIDNEIRLRQNSLRAFVEYIF